MLAWVIDNTKNNKFDLLELYCGNGNFSIALAPYFEKILATEISKTSVQSAQLNIQRNKIDNLKIARLSSEEFTIAANKEREFNRLKEQNINIDNYNFKTVLVDPPRAGLDINTIKLISQFDNIVYISCNPNTLANNLKELCKTHNVIKINFFDQFPYTEHIETGVILEKKK
jgi:tRNA (uracil-5-)-methyltransferase